MNGIFCCTLGVFVIGLRVLVKGFVLHFSCDSLVLQALGDLLFGGLGISLF